MGKLITSHDIRRFAKEGNRNIVISKGAIITPAARDDARALGVEIIYETSVAGQQVREELKSGKGRPIGAPLTAADDEDIHEIASDDIHWRESWYMNFTDPTLLIRGLCWMGVRPGLENGEVLFIIFEGDKCIHNLAKFDFPISKTIGKERMHFGPAKWQCVEPYKKWRMFFDDGSGVSADLTWTSVCAPFDWEYWDLTNSRHFEHQGRVQGTTTFAGRTINFNGFGTRDRAWGTRNNVGITQCLWNNAIFNENFAIFAIPITFGEKVVFMGYVFKDGIQSLISALIYDVIYSYPGGPPQSTLMKIQDEEGRHFEIKGETQNTLPILAAHSGEETFMTFNWLKYTCDNQIGYGMLDYWCSQRDAIIHHVEFRGDNRGKIYHEFKAHPGCNRKP